LTEFYFCPNCGNNLRERPKPISILTQIGLYILAIFLPPLGLWPGIKYLAKKGKQAKWVGSITIVLTLISSVIVTWSIFNLFNSYLSQLEGVLY
jgi:uncharacterized membrane protein YqaE (UPF0057 family)